MGSLNAEAVNYYGGEEVLSETQTADWKKLSVQFTTGANNTSARILLYKGGDMVNIMPTVMIFPSYIKSRINIENIEILKIFTKWHWRII